MFDLYTRIADLEQLVTPNEDTCMANYLHMSEPGSAHGGAPGMETGNYKNQDITESR